MVGGMRVTSATAFLGSLFLCGCIGTSTNETTDEAGGGSDDSTSGGTLKGIDVSNNVGAVDWTQVKADGYAFAFVKATDGVSYPPSVAYFLENWPKMKAAGIVRGAYHFYESGDDPVAQADYFADTLAKAGGLGCGDLPPVLDFERATSGANVLKFLKQLKSRTGRTPMIYVNESFASQYLSDPEFAEYPLWLAEYGVSTPKVPATWTNAGKSWTFWQYSESGKVSGVAGAGETDLDKFNGGSRALKQFISSTH